MLDAEVFEDGLDDHVRLGKVLVHKRIGIGKTSHAGHGGVAVEDLDALALDLGVEVLVDLLETTGETLGVGVLVTHTHKKSAVVRGGKERPIYTFRKTFKPFSTLTWAIPAPMRPAPITEMVW